jgi:hypothetical protein
MDNTILVIVQLTTASLLAWGIKMQFTMWIRIARLETVQVEHEKRLNKIQG